MNNMQKKHYELLEYLYHRENVTTSGQIAKNMHVTSRSVKTYVKEINSHYQSQVIISTPQGYLINHSIAKQLMELNDTQVPQDYNERAKFILKKILLEENQMDIYDLCETLYISESTLKTTLVKLNKTYSNFNVKFIVSKNNLFVEGSERDKRHLISNSIFEETESGVLDLSVMKKYFPFFDIETFKSQIVSIFQEHHYHIDDFSLMNIILHIFININRIIEGNNLLHDTQNVYDHSYHSSLMEQLCEYLENEFDIILDNNERKEIMILVDANSNDDTIIDKELYNFATEIADKIQEHYMIDLNKESFLKPFSLHLKKLSIRLKENMIVKNPLIEDIKKNCPIIYDMAVFVAIQIQNRLNTYQLLSEDEIAFIALHIGAEIERQKSDLPKLKSILLCPNYMDFQKKIYNQLVFEFHNELNILPPISDENDLKDDDLDIVFSTLPIQRKIEGCSIIQLSLIQDDINRLHILSVIDQKKKENKNKILKSRFHQYFFEENFYISHQHSDKDSVLSYLCEELRKKEFIDDEFIKDLYEREATCPTSFNDFSIPHSIKMNASQSCITVFIDTRGITWNEKEVHIVFLIAINKVDRLIFADLYEALIYLLNDNDVINQIKKSSSFAEFRNIIIRNIDYK